MATRTLEIDLRQGTGASSEPMYGVVTVQRAKAKSAGGFEILPFETTLKLINGKATITEAETDGTGPFYDSVYLFRVQNGYCAPRWGFMAALPDGSTPITTGELPMVDPITGEGIYMDAQEWNELYGDLPDRVTSLENSQSVQDGKIATLQTGKANTAHTHVIGDVTGLQPALNAKGNATMRVDTSVGTRVFITDGVTERLVSGDTGNRNIASLIPVGWTVNTARVRRIGSLVSWTFQMYPGDLSGDQTLFPTPQGFRPAANTTDALISLRGVVAGYFNITSVDVKSYSTAPSNSWGFLSIQYLTNDAWPTTLPGVPG